MSGESVKEPDDALAASDDYVGAVIQELRPAHRPPGVAAREDTAAVMNRYGEELRAAILKMINNA